MSENVVRKAGRGESPELGEPENRLLEIERGFDRGFFFDALADVESRADRRYEALTRRVSRLEDQRRAAGVGLLDDETKNLIFGAALLYAAVMLAPEIMAALRQWLARSGS